MTNTLELSRRCIVAHQNRQQHFSWQTRYVLAQEFSRLYLLIKNIKNVIYMAFRWLADNSLRQYGGLVGI